MEIKEVDIINILPITFDNNITINKDLSLNLNNNINKELLSIYKKSPFGLLLKDLKKYKLKNIKPNYIYINKDNKTLCKIIDKNELDDYNIFNINKLKDIYYIIIKTDYNIVSTKDLLEEEDEQVININPSFIPIEDEEEEKQKNIKLFE
jgi:hypothetical protein